LGTRKKRDEKKRSKMDFKHTVERALLSCLNMSPAGGRTDAILASSTLNNAWNFYIPRLL
jgi:hypothetical protein